MPHSLGDELRKLHPPSQSNSSNTAAPKRIINLKSSSSSNAKLVGGLNSSRAGDAPSRLVQTALQSSVKQTGRGGQQKKRATEDSGNRGDRDGGNRKDVASKRQRSGPSEEMGGFVSGTSRRRGHSSDNSIQQQVHYNSISFSLLFSHFLIAFLLPVYHIIHPPPFGMVPLWLCS